MESKKVEDKIINMIDFLIQLQVHHIGAGLQKLLTKQLRVYKQKGST